MLQTLSLWLQRHSSRPHSIVQTASPATARVSRLCALCALVRPGTCPELRPRLPQVLNLVPWGGVALQLPAVALRDPGGWDAAGAAVGAAYISDITAHQVPALQRRLPACIRVLLGSNN